MPKKTIPYTQEQCLEFLRKGSTELPEECRHVLQAHLQRKQSDPYAGMSPGEAAAARAAREKGQLNKAQIQRRMTTQTKKKRLWD